MVVLFVIATVLTFLIVDYVVQHRQSQLAPARTQLTQKPIFNSADDLLLPDGIFSASGHLWGELKHHGSLNVGIDPFLLNSIGRVERVHLPQKGQHIHKGDELLVLQVGDKKVKVRAPFAGIVEKTNSSLEENQHKNIRDLWTVRLKPENLPETLKSFRVGHIAKEWMKDEVARFRDFLASFSADPQLALTMQDGGLPVPGVLTLLDDAAWDKFENEFLSVES